MADYVQAPDEMTRFIDVHNRLVFDDELDLAIAKLLGGPKCKPLHKLTPNQRCQLLYRESLDQMFNECSDIADRIKVIFGIRVRLVVPPASHVHIRLDSQTSSITGPDRINYQSMIDLVKY
jgi:hypothetical protein